MHESLSKRKAKDGEVFNMEIMIRQKSGADLASVYHVVKAAFLIKSFNDYHCPQEHSVDIS
ncbi:MAG: hypothetical protein H6Q74_1863 [Firmicutes bacterium]|nr:hypothetical protein [Bacillota bacterium]